jgi:hypothetical protein
MKGVRFRSGKTLAYVIENADCIPEVQE